jgi:hypothetical protein
MPCEEFIALERKWKARVDQQHYYHFANKQLHGQSDKKARQLFKDAQPAITAAAEAMDRHRMQCEICKER